MNDFVILGVRFREKYCKPKIVIEMSIANIVLNNWTINETLSWIIK